MEAVRNQEALLRCSLALPPANLRLFRLLARGQYSTMVDFSWKGEVSALSLEFSQRRLKQILSKASPELSGFIRDQISRDLCSPRTIDFDGEVAFAVRARLGQLHVIQRESFVPLVAQEIL